LAQDTRARVREGTLDAVDDLVEGVLRQSHGMIGVGSTAFRNNVKCAKMWQSLSLAQQERMPFEIATDRNSEEDQCGNDDGSEGRPFVASLPIQRRQPWSATWYEPKK
jgi:hypothetical protein